MTRQQYWDGFEYYVRGQGFVGIKLNCYTMEINKGFQEDKNYEQLFCEIFDGGIYGEERTKEE